MSRFQNDPNRLTEEMLEGLAMVMDDYVEIVGHVVYRKGLRHEPARATILTLGGTGHEPSSLGFCGRGWEAVKVLGDIFAAPGPAAVLEGLRIADRGQGVLLYAGNHAGDVMTAKIAAKMARREGIGVELVVFGDDISSFSREQKEQRRGLVCSLGLGKVLGAACEQNYSVEELKRVAELYCENAASLAVATRGATHPVTGQPVSVIPDGCMVMGMGQHGEGASNAQPLLSSSETVELMLERIAKDLSLRAGEEVLLILNGAGSTSYLELMILYRDSVAALKHRGITVVAKIVGEYLTTQEQAGFQLCLVRLDSELKQLALAPCDTAFCRRG